MMESKGMERPAPILMRIYKSEAKLEVWKKVKATGKYGL